MGEVRAEIPARDDHNEKNNFYIDRDFRIDGNAGS